MNPSLAGEPSLGPIEKNMTPSRGDNMQRFLSGLKGFAMVWTMLVGSSAGAQLNPEGHTTVPRGSTAVTAEEILAALRQSRPANEIIPSDGVLGHSGGDARPPLLPEGFRVVNVVGHISQVGDWWVLHGQEGLPFPSIRLLFNRTLEQMVHATTGAGSQLLFAVSGEVSLCKGQNYLLPRVATRYNAPEKTALPGKTEILPVVSADAAADDVLSRMRVQMPEQEMLPVDTMGMPQPSRRNPTQTAPAADSVPLTQRPGRVWGQGERWTFSFESAADHPADLPLRVLPGQHLERIISALETSTMPLIFIVSGEVTTFDGSSYLLIRSAARRQSSVELGK